MLATGTPEMTPYPIITPYPVVNTYTFAPSADLSVKAAFPTTNWGTSPNLHVDGVTNPAQQSYLRFTINGIAGVVQSATVRLYAYSGSYNGPAIYSGSSNWSEYAITWNNRPVLLGSPVDNKGFIADNTWVEYNVSSLLRGTPNGNYSFVLVADAADGTHFYSREAGSVGHPSEVPQLVLTVANP